MKFHSSSDRILPTRYVWFSVLGIGLIAVLSYTVALACGWGGNGGPSPWSTYAQNCNLRTDHGSGCSSTASFQGCGSPMQAGQNCSSPITCASPTTAQSKPCMTPTQCPATTSQNASCATPTLCSNTTSQSTSCTIPITCSNTTGQGTPCPTIPTVCPTSANQNQPCSQPTACATVTGQSQALCATPTPTSVPSSSSYTLTVTNPGNLISDKQVSQLQAVFQYSYPKIVQRFGSTSTPKVVTLTVYSSSDGSVAYTSGSGIHINAVYQNKNTDDLGWLTHELTHVVQGYTGSNIPGWFTEGMADFCRYYYAPSGANPSWWQIPNAPTSSDSYKEAYGPAARFLIWLQQHKSAPIVDQLNKTLQSNQDFNTTFQQLAGGNVDQVWAQYVANPSIQLS